MRLPNFILVLKLILISVFGCEADRDNIDYRVPYVGNFTFSSYSYNHNYMMDTTIYYDTIVFEGLIELDTENDSSIIITYRPEESRAKICNYIEVYGSQIKPMLSPSVGYNQLTRSLDYPLIRSMCGPHGNFSGLFTGTDSIWFGMRTGSIGITNGQTVTGSRNK